MFTDKELVLKGMQATINFLNGYKSGLQVTSGEYVAIQCTVTRLNKLLDNITESLTDIVR